MGYARLYFKYHQPPVVDFPASLVYTEPMTTLRIASTFTDRVDDMNRIVVSQASNKPLRTDVQYETRVDVSDQTGEIRSCEVLDWHDCWSSGGESSYIYIQVP